MERVMQFFPTKLSDVVVVDPRVFEDKRGYFMETYNERDFSESGIEIRFVQTNMSSSKRGTLRGLHYQLAPYAQGKLVRVVKGSVFDVAVDLRKGSPAFGQWVGIELSQYNKRSVYIPPGFAHGFYLHRMADRRLSLHFVRKR
jgi:dTDP-4-dehydrorhamnose 3,5-epimerase